MPFGLIGLVVHYRPDSFLLGLFLGWALVVVTPVLITIALVNSVRMAPRVLMTFPRFRKWSRPAGRWALGQVCVALALLLIQGVLTVGALVLVAAFARGL